MFPGMAPSVLGQPRSCRTASVPSEANIDASTRKGGVPIRVGRGSEMASEWKEGSAMTRIVVKLRRPMVDDEDPRAFKPARAKSALVRLLCATFVLASLAAASA